MALKATDLRLSNWVTDKNSMPMWVNGIYKDVVYLDFEGNEGDEWEVDVDDIQPIPLTEDWLLKFDLKQGYDWLLRKPKELYSIPTDDQPLLFDLDNGLYYETEINDGRFYLGITKVEYVHELQNLYAALCGTELKTN